MVNNGNKKSKNELEKAVEAKIKAEKAKTLAEWQELQQDKKKLETERSKIFAKLDKKYPSGSENYSERYKDSEYEVISAIYSKLSWLEKVQKEMLYENYFLKHSKGLVNG